MALSDWISERIYNSFRVNGDIDNSQGTDIVNVAVSFEGDTFEISGKVAFSNHLVYNFRDFNDFFLTVYFTDAGGKINGEQNLTSAGVGQQIEKMSFNRRLTLPPGAEGMVFGYRGHAVDRSSGGSFGIDGSVDWEFWKTPTR